MNNMKVTSAVCKTLLVSFCYYFVLKQALAFTFCFRSTPTPNSTVHFVDKYDLVPKVHGCLKHYLTFRCCMADYASVKWFQKMKDGSWMDFLDNPIERALGDDDNQTAILKSPWDHGTDDGTYKCVGYGTRPGDTIEHSVAVSLRACPDLEKSSPFPFIPDKEESKRVIKLSTNVIEMCGAVFGTECSTTPTKEDCTFKWKMIGKHGRIIPAGNSTSGLRVYYENSGTASNVNDLTSVLHIIQALTSDYGTYVCTMENKFGKAERKITFTETDVVENLLGNYLGTVIVIAVFIVFFVLFIGIWFKWHIRIRWNEMKQRIIHRHGGEFEHDILLLHTSSVTVDHSFARYCRRKLELLGYRVIFEDDIPGGQNTQAEWLNRSDESQCVVIVLSPDFLEDEDEICRLPLREIIRTKANFLFVLFRFVSNKPIVVQMRDIEAAIKIKPNIRWSVDTTSFNGNSELYWEQLEDISAGKIDAFWKELASYLPQPLQTETRTALESERCDSEVSALLANASGKPLASDSA